MVVTIRFVNYWLLWFKCVLCFWIVGTLSYFLVLGFGLGLLFVLDSWVLGDFVVLFRSFAFVWMVLIWCIWLLLALIIDCGVFLLVCFIALIVMLVDVSCLSFVYWWWTGVCCLMFAIVWLMGWLVYLVCGWVVWFCLICLVRLVDFDFGFNLFDCVFWYYGWLV